MKKLLFIIVASLLPALWSACSSDGCLENQSSIPLACCYNSATGEARSLIGLSFHGVGAPRDSVLPASTAGQGYIYLPMRSTQPSTSWCIAYSYESLADDAFNDTVTFNYTAEPYFASYDCGAMYRYRIYDVAYTTHVIDSVVIADSLITNVDIVRIKIYFAPVEPTEP